MRPAATVKNVVNVAKKIKRIEVSSILEADYRLFMDVYHEFVLYL